MKVIGSAAAAEANMKSDLPLRSIMRKSTPAAACTPACPRVCARKGMR